MYCSAPCAGVWPKIVSFTLNQIYLNMDVGCMCILVCCIALRINIIRRVSTLQASVLTVHLVVLSPISGRWSPKPLGGQWVGVDVGVIVLVCIAHREQAKSQRLPRLALRLASRSYVPTSYKCSHRVVQWWLAKCSVIWVWIIQSSYTNVMCPIWLQLIIISPRKWTACAIIYVKKCFTFFLLGINQ